VIDVLTGERLGYRAVETAAGGTMAPVAATAPAGLPDAEIVDVAGRWLLPGLISVLARCRCRPLLEMARATS
jgi:cytosine/adenosine deaminase-related metal-dependent hydrolase